jgi:Pyruvate/2-oxoacid:ferredoxin oxidoreductase gamma subunit
MHHEYWAGVATKLSPRAIAVTNSSVFHPEALTNGSRVVEIDAATIATDMGLPRAATMIALGALAALTRLVEIDSLAAAAPDALPSYRQRHAAENVAALRAGAALMPEPLTNTWEETREVVAT